MGTDQKVIFNGDFISAQEPVVPVQSRGLMYGDGCFETLRSYSGSFLHLQEHVERFRSGARFLGLQFPKFFHEKVLAQSLEKLLLENGLAAAGAVIRFQLWREGRRGYQTEENSESNFAITVSKLPVIKESIKLALVNTRRIPDASLPSSFKLSNNINYIMAAREASAKGADDALMQTLDGHLSETTIANIFWIEQGTIYSPSKECDLLPGITRNILIELCEKLGVKVKQGKYTADKILDAEAVWICNSVREMVPVSHIGDTKFDIQHPVFKNLKEEFERYKKQNFS